MATHLKKNKGKSTYCSLVDWAHHLPLLFHTLKISQTQLSSTTPGRKWLSAQLPTGQSKETCLISLSEDRIERFISSSLSWGSRNHLNHLAGIHFCFQEYFCKHNNSKLPFLLRFSFRGKKNIKHLIFCRLLKITLTIFWKGQATQCSSWKFPISFQGSLIMKCQYGFLVLQEFLHLTIQCLLNTACLHLQEFTKKSSIILCSAVCCSPPSDLKRKFLSCYFKDKILPFHLAFERNSISGNYR